MRYAERRADFAKVSFGTGLVLYHRCSANHFQVGNSGKASEDFILYAISKVSILFLVTQILEREHCDALCRYRNHRG